MDAAARSLAAGSAVRGAAVEGDPGQRRTQQVRFTLAPRPFYV